MGFRRIPRSTILGSGAAVIAAAVLATTGIGQAAAVDGDGPTVYLSRHGAPTECRIEVWGTYWNGNPANVRIDRYSCDGTLKLSELKRDTEFKVKVWMNGPGKDEKVFTVKQTLNYDNEINNNTAICFLAKAGGNIIYTNMSAKGGDCNGD